MTFRLWCEARVCVYVLKIRNQLFSFCLFFYVAVWRPWTTFVVVGGRNPHITTQFTLQVRLKITEFIVFMDNRLLLEPNFIFPNIITYETEDQAKSLHTNLTTILIFLGLPNAHKNPFAFTTKNFNSPDIDQLESSHMRNSTSFSKQKLLCHIIFTCNTSESY